MSSVLFTLVGANAGKTLNILGHDFVNGVYEYFYDNPEHITLKAQVLKTFGAFLQHELADAQEAITDTSENVKEDTKVVDASKASKAAVDCIRENTHPYDLFGEGGFADQVLKFIGLKFFESDSSTVSEKIVANTPVDANADTQPVDANVDTQPVDANADTKK